MVTVTSTALVPRITVIGNGRADAIASQPRDELLRFLDRFAVEADDHIADQQARRSRRDSVPRRG